MKGLRRRLVFLSAAVVCFALAALVLAGMIVGDLVGRLMFGMALAAVGTVWLGAYLGLFWSPRNGTRDGSDGA